MKPPPDKIPSGLCECGCGQRTPIAKQSRPQCGQYYGYPIRYIRGHNQQGKRGSDSNAWSGGRKVNKDGYVLLLMPGHHLANGGGYALEHRHVWEQANDRRLSPGEQVHHIDGNRSNNDPANLVALTMSAHQQMHAKDHGHSEKSDGLRRRYQDPEERRKTSESMKRIWAARKAARSEA